VKQQPKMSPVPLLFEPGMPEPDQARFFGLDEIADPAELLGRATELAEAFRAAAERAAAYQALAAHELTDPRRFDRLTFAELGERIGLSPADAQTLAERGQRLAQRSTRKPIHLS
jgi:hypothetical protein